MAGRPKKLQTTMRLRASTIKALDEVAAEEGISRTQLFERISLDWRKGYWDRKAQARRRAKEKLQDLDIMQ